MLNGRTARTRGGCSRRSPFTGRPHTPAHWDWRLRKRDADPGRVYTNTSIPYWRFIGVYGGVYWLYIGVYGGVLAYSHDELAR